MSHQPHPIRKRLRVLRLIIGICPVVALAEPAGPVDAPHISVNEAMLAVKADCERDTGVLNARRAEIAAQRQPLAEQLDALRGTVRERRAEVARLRRQQQHGEREQAALEAEVAGLEDACHFLRAIFTEYARAMETRVSTAEAARWTARLQPIQTDLMAGDAVDGLADAVGRLLALSAAFNADRLGGSVFEGAALDDDGIEHAGRFVALGPTAYFAAYEKGPAGLAVTRFGAVQPAVYDRFPAAVSTAIRSLVAGAPARVPVDVTDGDAIKVARARTTFAQHVRKGGLVMVPLLVVAIAAIALSVWKAIDLAGIRVDSGEAVAIAIAAARRGDSEAARQAAANIRQPLRTLVEEAIEHRNAPRDHIEERLHACVLNTLPRLERHLGTLAVLGGIAPLLGLLGTVTGMIHTFQLVTLFGSGDAKLLSGGISEALVTTEAGLVIAIPVLLVHAFLARRARGTLGSLERAAVGIVNDLTFRSADA